MIRFLAPVLIVVVVGTRVGMLSRRVRSDEKAAFGSMRKPSCGTGVVFLWGRTAECTGRSQRIGFAPR